MRHLVFNAPGDLQWREVADPTIDDDHQALVRPIAVARCDLDPAIALGLYPMRGPFPMGHEMVGEVVDRGEAAGPFEVGDRVIVPFQISCGTCPMCRRGLTNACESVPPGSAFGLGPHGGVEHGGALADLVRVPHADHLLLPLPDGVDPVAAAGIPDNVADGYRCVAGPMAEWPGEAVLVVGGLAQSVGLYAVAAAAALGAPRVVYVDQDPERLRVARSLGAEIAAVALADLTATEQFAVTVDACVLDQGRNHALRSTRPCGTCTSVSGGAGASADLPLQSMYLKGIRYEIGRVHARATAEPVLDLVTAGRLDPTSVVSRVVPFADAVDAMTDPAVKIVFTNDG
ncbi:MAG: alcohol dehydrogenase catalytic domain-containing protein [Acidimicrobiales bacterium]|nr:alcohol dehydrogenase catalytic domain-containing protein [Acidimicrobiales bacterium]